MIVRWLSCAEALKFESQRLKDQASKDGESWVQKMSVHGLVQFGDV